MSDKQKILEYLEQMVAESEAASSGTGGRQRLQSFFRPAGDIAVVAMACRFPGGINSPSELWRFVAAGGRITACLPGAVDPGLAGFSELDDAPAAQRLLLDAADQTLEAAGLDPDGLRGSRTGVFVELSPDPEAPGEEPAAGEELLPAGRITYHLGTDGPVGVIDVGDAAPLAALHRAVGSLRRHECARALVGAVTLRATRPGAGGAPGAGGERPGSDGVGMLLLERLVDAQRHGRRVLAVVRGSAVEHDSTGAGQDGPNGTTQRRAIRQALRDARLTPDLIDAVEAHAAGSTLGNLVEAQALITVYGKGRTRANPMWLGSVASNLGDASAVAGLASVVKAVYALEHGVLPSSVGLEPSLEQVRWGGGGVRPLTGNLLWPVTGLARRIGICGWGSTGTSVHVILEAPVRSREKRP